MRGLAPAFVLLPLALTLAVPACTTDGVPGPAAQSPTAAAQDLAPAADVLAAIPFPADDAPDRAADVLMPLMVPGDHEYRCSDGSYDEDTHHVLPADLGQLEWAIYRLPTNGFPALSLEVELQRLIGDTYFGIANFVKGSWEISNPLTTSLYTRGLNANYISPTGRVYIMVAAYNMSTTRVVKASIILDQPGWVHSVVADSPVVAIALELFKEGDGGMPRLAVLRERSLDYMTSGPYMPQDPIDWDSVRAVLLGPQFNLAPPLKATFVGGGPALAYNFDGSNWEVRYTYATIPNPTEADWITTQVHGSELAASGGLGLCEFNGTPRVAYAAGYSTTSIMLAASPVPYPDSFDWVQSMVAESGARPSIACVNDLLACSFMVDNPLTRVKYARALTGDPTGPASWSVSDASYDMPMDYGALSTVIADPMYGGEAPTVLYRGHSGSSAQVACSTLLEPAAPADWAHNPIEFPSVIGGNKMELKLIRGGPAVVYYLENERRLQLAWGHNDPPAVPDDWTIFVIASDVDVSAVTLEEISNMAAVAYFDYGAMQIKYAYYEGLE